MSRPDKHDHFQRLLVRGLLSRLPVVGIRWAGPIGYRTSARTIQERARLPLTAAAGQRISTAGGARKAGQTERGTQHAYLT